MGLLTFTDDRERLQRRRSGRWPRPSARAACGALALERLDGEALVGSPLEPLLVEHGFRAGPRKLTLSA